MTVFHPGSMAQHRIINALAWAISGILLPILFAADLTAQDVKVIAPEKVGLSVERLAILDKVIQEEIDQKRKAGIVVLIARNGSIAHFKAFGMADIESGIKMRTDHIFRLFSMTKPVTSAALLTLYEEGKFQLADPLEQYIPAFKDVKVFGGFDNNGKMILEEPKRKITIHDVFRHTAGLAYGFGDTPIDKLYQEAGVGFGEMGSLEDLVNKLATVPLLYHPGDRWVYSFAHDVQAYLIEYFSGMRFDEFVRNRIIRPLGMNDSIFSIPNEYVTRLAPIYSSAEDGGLRVWQEPEEDMEEWKSNPSSAPGGSGGTGLSSTAMDYYLFSQMLLNKGKLGDVRILGKKTVEMMTSSNLPPLIQNIGYENMEYGFGYGLGIGVLLDPARSGNLGSKGAFGWGGAATTRAWIDPKEKLIALLFTQYMPADMNFRSKFRTLVYQAIAD